MREILFRAKKDDMSDFKFVYGYLTYNEVGEPRIYHYETNTFTTCVKGTEGQFTGLSDKNGNKIFEKDIVNADERRFDSRVKTSIFVKREVIYTNGCFCLLNSQIDLCHCDRIEIIGNTIDNTELIK